MTMSSEELNIVERKIIRTIIGSLKHNKNEYRQRRNYEIEIKRYVVT